MWWRGLSQMHAQKLHMAQAVNDMSSQGVQNDNRKTNKDERSSGQIKVISVLHKSLPYTVFVCIVAVYASLHQHYTT